MVDRSKIGRNNRRRGADFERYVVNYLRSSLANNTNIEIRRRMQWAGNSDPDVGIYLIGDIKKFYRTVITYLEARNGRQGQDRQEQP